MWMNEYEIDNAQERYGKREDSLGEAVRALSSLRHATNSKSDGWPYFRKPASAARSLMALIDPEGFNPWRGDAHPGITPAQLSAALRPVKAFRTRQDWKFDITDAERRATAGRLAAARSAARRAAVAALARKLAPVLTDELSERLAPAMDACAGPLLRIADIEAMAVRLAEIAEGTE